MKILVVSNNYPSEQAPSYGVFVYKLVQQFAKLGHEITIISPQGILPRFVKNTPRSYGKELGTVYRPTFLSASAKNIFGFNTYRIGEFNQVRAVRRTVVKHNIEFDVIYAHFLSNAFIAVQALKSFGKPIFAAVGEYNNIDVRRAYYSPDHYRSLLSELKGFIAVSPQVQNKLISLGVPKVKIIMKPNGVDFNFFYKRDKSEMRRKHKLPLDQNLAIFVGRLVENKGPLRVAEAVKDIDGIELMVVGSGPQEVSSQKMAFAGKVPVEMVPELLSAADFFVLPTLHEGSCNAIVEAMACGLPIISSDLPEIKVQCDPSFSILVNPMDVKAIRKAMLTIISDREKQIEMSKNALEYSKKFDIRKRAKDILNFIGREE